MSINANKIRGIIAEKQLSQAKVARAIGITPRTFCTKMRNGTFNGDQIQQMMELLDIENPVGVFFSPIKKSDRTAIRPL